MLCDVLPGDATEGWEGLRGCPLQLLSFNGQPVRNLEHLARLLVSCSSEPFLRLQLADGQLLVVDGATVQQATVKILKANELSHAISNGLRTRLGTNWPFKATDAGSQRSRLRVQRSRSVKKQGRLVGG